jgi:DNA-binding protein WhiA
MLCGAAEVSEEGVRLETENPAVALQFTKLIKEAVGIRDKSETILTVIEDRSMLDKLFGSLDLSANAPVPDTSIIQCEFCRWAFVKGLFLTCGTITKPDNAYHMEFLLRNEESAGGIAAFLTDLGAPPKITERRGGLCGVYYKDSESVVDILGHLGANRAAFKMLDVKIMKDIRNNANRVANCDANNIDKSTSAAHRQVALIRRLIEENKLSFLPPELVDTARARVEYPSLSLGQLAQTVQPPLTKSGLNHRLARIMELCEKLLD